MRSPGGVPAKLVSAQVGNRMAVGQQVVILYFDRKKSLVL